MRKFMKKVLPLVLILAMVVGMIPAQATEATEVPTIYVEEVTDVVAGESVIVPIKVKNTTGIAGLDLTVGVPEGWTIEDFYIETDTYSIFFTLNKFNKYVQVGNVTYSADTAKFAYAHDSAVAVPEEGGVICWVEFNVPVGAVEAKYEITLDANVISTGTKDDSGNLINEKNSFTLESGSVEVTDGTPVDDITPVVAVTADKDTFAYGETAPVLTATITGPDVVGTMSGQWYRFNYLVDPIGGTAIQGATGTTLDLASVSDLGGFGYCAFHYVVKNTYMGVTKVGVATAAVTYTKAEIGSVDVSIETPVKNAVPQSTIAGTNQYDAAITWSPEAGSKFAANTAYTATVVLTIKDSNYKFADSVAATGIGTFAPAEDGTLTVTKTFDKTADRELTNIEITTDPTKVDYIDGETFDKTGMVVTAYYDNGESEVIDGYTVSNTNMEMDTTAVTVSYGGKTDTVAVTVEANTLQGIEVSGNFKTDYLVLEEANWNNMVVTATYKRGNTETVTGYTISGFDSGAIAGGATVNSATRTVTVSYGDKSDTFDIIVSKRTIDELDVTRCHTTYPCTYDGGDHWIGLSNGWINELSLSDVNFTKYYAAVNGNEVGDLTTNKPQNAGVYNVYYTFGGNEYWKAVTEPTMANGVVTIDKVEPTVTVDPTSITVKVEASSDAVSVTVPSDGAGNVSYAVENTEVATWDETNKKVVGKAVGSTNLVVTVAEGVNYTEKTVKIPVSVVPLEQQVFADGFAGNVEKTYGDAEFTHAADLTTGTGEITYESEDESVAIVNDDGKVTIKGAGTTTITATAAKVTGVYAETSVSYTLIVGQKEVGLTWAGYENLEYSGNRVNVTATATGVVLGDTVTVTVTGGAQTDAGSYTATAEALDNDNYKLPAVKTQPYTIARKVIDVPTANALTYNSEVQTGVDADDEGTYTVTGNNTGTNVGNYTAVVTPTSNYKWEDSTDGKEVSWSISAYDVTGTAVTDTTNKTQNVVVNVGTFVAPTFTGFKGETVDGAVAYSYGSLTDKAAIEAALAELGKGDTAEITYTFTAAGNYTGTRTGTIAVTMVDIAFKVGSADATAENAVTVKSAPTYGDTWAEIVTIGDIKASVDGTEVEGTYTLNVSGMPNAGEQTYEVIFNAADTTKYQNVKVFAGTVNVAQKEVAVVWSNLTKTYNGQTQHPNASAAGVNGQVISVDTSFTVATKDAGTYTCTATTTDSNYLLTNNTAEFTISPVEVTAVWSDTTVTYNGEAQYPLATVRTGVAGEALTVAISMNENAVNVGSYTATVRISDGVVAKASNYVLVGDTQATFTVNPAKVTVNWTNTTLTYNGQEQAPTATATGVKSEAIALTVSGAKINKGSYTATASTENVNYTLEGASVDYTIAAKNLTVGVESIDDVSYTGSVHTPTVILTGTEGFDLVKDTDYTVMYTDNKVAGTATVTVTVKSTSNFNFAEVVANFTILKADVTVSADDLTLEYTGVALEDSAIVGTAKLNGKDVAGTWNWVEGKQSGVNAGEYDCQVQFTPADTDNFNVPAALDIKVSITKAEITAEDIQIDTRKNDEYGDMTLAEMLEDLLDEQFGELFEELFNAGAITIVGEDGENMTVAEMNETGVSANTEYTVVIDTTVLPDGDLKDAMEANFAVGEDGTLSVVVTPYIYEEYVMGGGKVQIMPTTNGSVTSNMIYAAEDDVVKIKVNADDGYKLTNLSVVDFYGRKIDLTARGNGVYTFVMSDVEVYVYATFEAISAEPQFAFVDVAEKDWYYNAVYYVYNAGLMNGTGNDYFSPSVKLTRAMMMTLLARLDGVDTTGGEFWYSKGMEWAMAEGISDGTNPNGEITREQAVTMMYRFVGSPAVEGNYIDGFADDAAVSSWAEAGMNWAVSVGLVQGNAGKLNPTGTASRAEIATMLMRFVENVMK